MPLNLPSTMTWEELGLLPDEIAGEIELWEGRVVWARRGPAEYQDCSNQLWTALRRCARADTQTGPENCWRVGTNTDIFLGPTTKDDYLTPDFLIYNCLKERFQDILAADVHLVGEVMSPSNTRRHIEAKKARYANAGIPWYWEVALGRGPQRTAVVSAYALETGHGRLPLRVTPLRSADYVLVDQWRSAPPGPDELEGGVDPGELPSDGIVFDFPFPINIPWSELEY
ncbi:Uma2 family endonuclease [Nocardia alni]|uniref:Uma2 family endonuclease n=1 Tax=Nocardia alni TaxID=2815723 RepID=UPI0020B3B2CE|nr:Uma2 family endonuclease [Nocardia alni]